MVAFCSYGTDFVQILDAADRILASFLQHCILLCVFVSFYNFFTDTDTETMYQTVHWQEKLLYTLLAAVAFHGFIPT